MPPIRLHQLQSAGAGHAPQRNKHRKGAGVTGDEHHTQLELGRVGKPLESVGVCVAACRVAKFVAGAAVGLQLTPSTPPRNIFTNTLSSLIKQLGHLSHSTNSLGCIILHSPRIVIDVNSVFCNRIQGRSPAVGEGGLLLLHLQLLTIE